MEKEKKEEGTSTPPQEKRKNVIHLVEKD